MRKLYSLFVLLWLTTLAVWADKSDLYLLQEGFEDGFPASWTQENIVGGGGI